MLLSPNPTNICFGCGGANARGMKLTFEQDGNTKRIRGAFKLAAEYQGGPGFIHGGIIATVLDEAGCGIFEARTGGCAFINRSI
jgi:hypothetical protein